MPAVEQREAAINYLLTSLRAQRGYDFTDYQPPFVMRRLDRVGEQLGLAGGLTELAARFDENPTIAAAIIESMTIGVTEMFRDPPFWSALRQHLQTNWRPDGLLRCWVAGCSTGEEAYSLAITLRECGYAGRYLIYATDINESALAQCRTGALEGHAPESASTNYQLSGGTGSLSAYFEPSGAPSSMPGLCDSSMLFARHNLVTDSAFNFFHLVLCRNVMIYFDRRLHIQVHELFHRSLTPNGLLGLGARESLASSPHAKRYRTLGRQARLYERLP